MACTEVGQGARGHLPAGSQPAGLGSGWCSQTAGAWVLPNPSASETRPPLITYSHQSVSTMQAGAALWVQQQAVLAVAAAAVERSRATLGPAASCILIPGALCSAAACMNCPIARAAHPSCPGAGPHGRLMGSSCPRQAAAASAARQPQFARTLGPPVRASQRCWIADPAGIAGAPVRPISAG